MKSCRIVDSNFSQNFLRFIYVTMFNVEYYSNTFIFFYFYIIKLANFNSYFVIAYWYSTMIITFFLCFIVLLKFCCAYCHSETSRKRTHLGAWLIVRLRVRCPVIRGSTVMYFSLHILTNHLLTFTFNYYIIAIKTVHRCWVKNTLFYGAFPL